MYTSVHTLFFR